jgi:hypothetical protein
MRVGAMLGAGDHDVAATCVTRCLLNGAEQLSANAVAPRRPTYRERREMRDRFRVMNGIGHLNGRECPNHAVRHRDKDVSVSCRPESREPPGDVPWPHRVPELPEQLCERLCIGIHCVTNIESHLSSARGYADPDVDWVEPETRKPEPEP